MLDIKLTRYDLGKKKRIYTLLVLLIAFILSLIMIYRYHSVELQVQENKQNPFQSRQFASDLFYTDYYLYYKIYQQEKNQLIRPVDLFLTKETIQSMINNLDMDYYSSELDADDIKYNFDESFKELGGFINDSEGKLKYFAINKKTGFEYTNYLFKDDMKAFDNYQRELEKVNNDVTKIDKNSEAYKDYINLQKKIRRKFMTYIVIDFDSNGKYDISYSYGLQKEVFDNYLLELDANKNLNEVYTISDVTDFSFSNYRVEPIKNMRYVYAIPNSVNTNFYSSHDTVSEYVHRKERNSYRSIEILGRSILAIIVVITLLIPIRTLKLFMGLEKLKKLPLEVFVIALYYLHSSLLSNDVAIMMVRETITGNVLKSLLANDIPLVVAKQLVNIINIAYWMLSFFSVYLIACLIKMVIKNGITGYLRKRSLILCVSRAIVRGVSSIFYRFISVDLSLRYNRLFIIGFILVFFGTVILPWVDVTYTLLWFVLMLVYILVFLIFTKIVKKEIDNGKDDYEGLLGLTKDIASGNLDQDIMKVDVGIYEEIQRQLFSIQQAYKKSIEEEVKSQKMKSDLISNVSHDLKTPLTSIITYIELLKNTETSDDAKKYIDTISRKSERLKILIDDMFEITKAQSGNLKVNIDEVEVVNLMKQSIFEVSDRFSTRGITLKTSFPEEKIILKLDGEKTYRTFENLLVNIAKYSAKDSRAYVDIKNEDERVVITFRNISETEIDYDAQDILERFRRGDKSRNTEGSGLGLSIAKGYVEIQGGELNIHLDGDLFKSEIIFYKNKEIISGGKNLSKDLSKGNVHSR
ncbi:MAG: HAMP domain-containing sensor histidine kinase [Peptostreptococcus porci]|uniref:sensor histidine kinase n=1 Tax=Peptostreptococcus porci TaxID=2652282 RepID=UPI002A7489D6|nr:HAMP domain-containing sensor histidine kinase [Peptostreptococcus porci]MDY2794454.1 HAMP domain-containing sensor histidine kinase [Peptostreptococcus porci]MDY5479063.1 HAMP domain-containing sensor histidine kinase [Peptostreptococcus porci]